MRNSRFWIAASLTVGTLQAWDSGAFGSGVLAALLSLAGIAVPTAAIAVRGRQSVCIAGLAIGGLLLLAARIAAPQPLNALHLALFPAAVYILFVKGVMPSVSENPA